LNIKYVSGQSVNIVKSYESNQPNMNLTTKGATNVLEELKQSKENSDTKSEGIQQIKAKLG
jgi:hypothetical protein